MVKQYPEIENTYREKTLAIWLERFPELEVAKYVIQEKVDGANIRIFFSPEKSLRFGSRGQMLDESRDSFYGLVNIVPIYKDVFDKLQAFSCSMKKAFTIFGEFFGKGIQKGIDYNVQNAVGKQILFYDIWFEDDERMSTQEHFYSIMKELGLGTFVIPTIGFVDGLKEVIEYEQIFESKVSGLKDVFAEGIVIKPWNKQYTNPLGQTSKKGYKTCKTECSIKFRKSSKLQNTPARKKYQREYHRVYQKAYRLLNKQKNQHAESK